MMLVLDAVLDADGVAGLRRALDAVTWHDGQTTAGALARAVKRNRQADPSASLPLGDVVLRALARQPRFASAALPAVIHPPRFNRHGVGEHYGTHVDAAVMQVGDDRALRSDLSATLCLSAPGDYDGGVLEIDSPLGVHALKLPAGSLVLYPSHSLHRVTPVTRGERVACFFWVQSLVREDLVRTALFDLDESIQALRHRAAPDDPVVLRLTAAYHNLLRRHAGL